MDSTLPSELGLLSPFPYLPENTMIFCRLPISKIIQIKVRDQLNPLNAWSQTIESKELTRPTSAKFSTVPTVRCLCFFPHTKLFNETYVYLYNDTMDLEISFFLTHQYVHRPSLLFFFLFRRDPQYFSISCQWGELSQYP